MKLVNAGNTYNKLCVLQEAHYDVSYAEAVLKLYVESENEWNAFREYTSELPGSVVYEYAERKVFYDAIRNYFYNAFLYLESLDKNGLISLIGITGTVIPKTKLDYLINRCEVLPKIPEVDSMIKTTPMMHTLYANWLIMGTGSFDIVDKVILSIEG